MNGRQALLELIFVLALVILAIYLYDIFNCIFTDSPIPSAELAIFLVLLIGTMIIAIVFRRELRSLIQNEKSNANSSTKKL